MIPKLSLRFVANTNEIAYVNLLIFVKIGFLEIFFLEKIRDSYRRKRVGKISLKSGLSVEIAHFFV